MVNYPRDEMNWDEYVRRTIGREEKKTVTEKRIGDRQRGEASQYIGECYAAGFLDDTEREERQAGILKARYQSDLNGFLNDLPTRTELTGEAVEKRIEKRVPYTVRVRQFFTSMQRDHWCFTSVSGMLLGLLISIVPSCAVQTAGMHWLTPLIAATTVPVGTIVFLASLVWLISKSIDA